MIGKKYDKFFYFRTAADENDDDDLYSSVTIPVNRITGILPISRTIVRIHYVQGWSGATAWTAYGVRGVNASLSLTVNQDTGRDVIKAIVDATNNAPPSGLIVIADDATTDVDGSTKQAKYIHRDIVSLNQMFSDI